MRRKFLTTYSIAGERRHRRRRAGIAVTTLILQSLVSTATAAPTSNDDVANAVEVGHLPFFAEADTRAATRAPDEPEVTNIDCPGTDTHTVWYRLTLAEPASISVDTAGSSYDTTLAVFRGAPDSLEEIDCNDDFGGQLHSRLIFRAQEGVTYYLRAASSGGVNPGGDLVLEVDTSEVPPLEATVTVDEIAYTEPSTGEIVLSGQVTCNRPATVGLDGAVDQGATHSFVFPEPFECPASGSVAWSASSAERQGGRYGPGEASVLMYAYTWDEHDRDVPKATVNVEVRAPRIAYARSTRRTEDLARYEIYTMNEDGSDVVRLTDNSVADEFPAFSPNGSKIAFARMIRGDAYIYVMNSDGSGVRRLAASNGNDALPAWSPDGKWIVFTRWMRSQADLFKIRASGRGSAIRLTQTRAWEFAPEWSPDGRLIAFTKFAHQRDRYGIATVRPDGTGTRWLTTNPDSASGYNDMHPTWSPDGSKIAFVREHGYEVFVDLFTVNRDGADVKQLTDERGLVEAPTWGPDRRIAFMSNNGIGVVSSEGGSVEMITPFGRGIRQHEWPDWAGAVPR